MSNWILDTWKKLHIKITEDPICGNCGKTISEHTNKDLENCSEIY